MASPRIILILACVCLAECRMRGIFNKLVTSPTNHKKIQEANTNIITERKVNPKINTNNNVAPEAKTNKDIVPEVKTGRHQDVIVFPKDEDIKVYLDVNKLINEASNTMNSNRNVAASTTSVPLLPKVVPAFEAKEVFTNPIASKVEEAAFKTKDDKENIQSLNPIHELGKTKVAIDAIIEKNSNITLDNSVTEALSNDTSSSNVPDFASRFGVTGNYVVVPANNVQTSQPVQVPNVPVQGNAQQYSGQGNTITPLTTNAGATSNANTPNVNSQYSLNTNALLNERHTTPNVPETYNVVTQGTNNVPISVGNTYMINGQLYAAVTVPNNVNVPSSMYLVNPQVPQGSGHQMNNNLPVYKLVSVGQGQGNNVNQYVSIN